MTRRPFAWGLLVAALAVASACHTHRRFTRAQLSKTLDRLEDVGLELGDFDIDGSACVVDGDTLRVRGLESTLRLLAIDTEETFKETREKEAFDAGWASYLKRMRGTSQRPVEMATPLGETAKEWAEAFFDQVETVRLERDHPGEIRDHDGRYLAYVFVARDGRWVNYNIEAVRAGMTPYFTKHGRSRRFHDELVRAQDEARSQKLGIWDPKRQHYPDYDERLAWWNERAELLGRFEGEASPDKIVLTRQDALSRLEKQLGKRVEVIGEVGEVPAGDQGPTVVKLSRARGNDLDVVFSDKAVFLASGIRFAKGEYVRVAGVVRRHRDQKRKADRLQLVVSLPDHVLAPGPELDRLLGDPPGDPSGDQPE